MTDLQTLLQAVDDLTPDEIKQLYTYILENHIRFTLKQTVSTSQPRVLGLHAHLGKAWMSDDFRDVFLNSHDLSLCQLQPQRRIVVGQHRSA